MGKQPKKPITKRPWFWPVVGVVAVGAIAGGGGDKEEQKQTPVEPEKSIVEIDTSNRSTLPDISKPVQDVSKDESKEKEPDAEPETQKKHETVTSQQTGETMEQDKEPIPETDTEPVVAKQPEQEPTSDPVIAPDPPKNTNSAGKERRGTWESGNYMASAESDKYHDYECRAAKNILPGNEIWFHSEEEAQAAGYSRCGICWR